MSKAWVARYEYGKDVVEEVEVLKATPKQVTISEGAQGSGYRTRLSPEEVHATEADALRKLLLDADIALRRAEAEAQRHRDAMARVVSRLDALTVETKAKETP
jgi:hypothetical protein